MSDDRFDVVIIGGGHNGLVAAAYLARAGRRVRVLERLRDSPDQRVDAVRVDRQAGLVVLRRTNRGLYALVR